MTSQPEFRYPNDPAAQDAKNDEIREQTRSRFPRAVEVLEAGIERGWQTGVQLYVSQNREVLVDLGFGTAEQDVAMTSSTLVPWFCNAKPGLAVAFGVLWQRQLVQLDTPVSDVIPEFAGGGKHVITFRHLLTHTTGLRPDPAYAVIGSTAESMLATICAAEYPAGERPGRSAYYSGITSWFLLGTAIERLAQCSLQAFMQSDVYGPLNIEDTFVRMTGDEFAAKRGRLATLFQRSPLRQAYPLFSHPSDFQAFLPGLLCVGPIRSLGRLFEALLPGDSGSTPVLESATREAITTSHRVGMYDAHWAGYHTHGLGVIVDGSRHGKHCSPRAFGYRGRHSSLAVADPEHGLVITAFANVMTPDTGRDRMLVEAVYADLGLDDAPVAPRIVEVTPVQDVPWIDLPRTEDSSRRLTERDPAVLRADSDLMHRVHGVVQAGGLGQRLLPATTATPKPLLTVLGQPMVERMVRQMCDAGVRRITVIVGWLGEQIERHLRNLSDLPSDLRLDFIRETEARGNIGSLGEVATDLDLILFAFGDLMTTLDFRQLVQLNIARGEDATLATHAESHRLQLGETVTRGDRVIAYNEKPLKEFLICSGIAVFQPTVRDEISKTGPVGISDLISRLIDRRYRVGHWTHGAKWIDVNSPDLLQAAEVMFATDESDNAKA